MVHPQRQNQWADKFGNLKFGKFDRLPNSLPNALNYYDLKCIEDRPKKLFIQEKPFD